MATEIKMCGLANADDLAAALDLGVDYVGFVLYAKSPRGITAAAMGDLLDALPARPRAVGVFVNVPPVEVARIASEHGLHAVQIHGDEAPDGYDAVPAEVWRAVRVAAGGLSPVPSRWPAARYVVDAALPGIYGGTGVVADWGRAAALAVERPVMLAGGLTAGNVAEAVRVVAPLGVDVASGVEAAPGRKDHRAMRLFVEAVRQSDGGRA